MPGYDERFYIIPSTFSRTRTRLSYNRSGPRLLGPQGSFGYVESFRSNPISNPVLDSIPKTQSYKDRLAFYKEASRAGLSVESPDTIRGRNARGQRVPLSKGDYGHEFTSVVRRSHRVRQEIRYADRDSKDINDNLSEMFAFPATDRGVGMVPAFVGTSAISSVGSQGASFLRKSFPRDEALRVIASSVPKGGGLGETLLELLSLQFPKVLASLRSLTKTEFNRAAKTSAYVNKGWHALSKREKARIAEKLGVDIKDVKVDPDTLRKYRKLEKSIGKTPAWLVTSKKAAGSAGADYVGVRFGLEPVVQTALELVDIVRAFESATAVPPEFRRRRVVTIGSGSFSVNAPAGIFGTISDPRGNPNEGYRRGWDAHNRLLVPEEHEASTARYDRWWDHVGRYSPEAVFDITNPPEADVPTIRSRKGSRNRGVSKAVVERDRLFPSQQSLAFPEGVKAPPPTEYFWEETLSISFKYGGKPEDSSGGYYSSDNIVRRLGLWTPSLGWDILPWSWFIDWFGSISRALKMDHFFTDRPLAYCYATYRATVTRVRPRWRHAGDTAVFPVRPYSCNFGGFAETVTTTVRKAVSPFGDALHGFTGLDLDSYKTAILVGLGLAKLK